MTPYEARRFIQDALAQPSVRRVVVGLDAFSGDGGPGQALPSFDETRLAVTPDGAPTPRRGLWLFTTGYLSGGALGMNALSALLGGNFADNRGNATLVISWTDRQALMARDRQFYVDGWRDPNNAGGDFPQAPGLATGGNAGELRRVLKAGLAPATGVVTLSRAHTATSSASVPIDRPSRPLADARFSAASTMAARVAAPLASARGRLGLASTAPWAASARSRFEVRVRSDMGCKIIRTIVLFCVLQPGKAMGNWGGQGVFRENHRPQDGAGVAPVRQECTRSTPDPFSDGVRHRP